MIQRADYYIEKVRYNKSHTRIMWVSVRQDSSNKLSGAFTMLRKKIIRLANSGKEFMTIYRNDEGKFRRGQKVSVVCVQGVDYLRTDEGGSANDQLENLPEY